MFKLIDHIDDLMYPSGAVLGESIHFEPILASGFSAYLLSCQLIKRYAVKDSTVCIQYGSFLSEEGVSIGRYIHHRHKWTNLSSIKKQQVL